MTPPITQSAVNTVWDSVWRSDTAGDPKKIFAHRLFIEGYRVLHPLIPKNTRTILETGTGTGRYAAALARDFQSAKVTASDIVPASLKSATLLKNALALQNLSIEQANVEELQYPDNCFDVVFSDALIQHVPNDNRAVIEMARVLRPSGILILTGINRFSFHGLFRWLQSLFRRPYRYGFERLYTHQELRGLIKNAGLTVVSQGGFYPAYGIYRLKYFSWSGFGFIGRVLNRITRTFDKVTGNFISRYIGFQLYIVARK
ncbi:methyltransferase domain-containing protein [Candidatus Parcubacteria bacterium]|nr:methyltransferase domain-containing protein [Candidatus Parcubacteria bacterium]